MHPAFHRPQRNGGAAEARVLILGAGFGGLEAAKALGKAGVHVTIIDRQNHHLFQPLLYQVATAALSAADIAEPIRSILRDYPTVNVVMGQVVEIDHLARAVRCAHGARFHYDTLVVATGAQTGYFGNDHWRTVAPGLKTIEDARAIRTKVLQTFEEAERSDDAAERERLMTIAVIGGGPTGVELSGAIAELSRYTLARDFRRIVPQTTTILLVEGGPRILDGFAEPLSTYARARLERLGVTVLTGARVDHIGEGELGIDGSVRPVGLVIWAAGVTASPLARQLGETDKSGRIAVTQQLEVPNRPGIFALGDIALVRDASGAPLPGLAQVAKQQGRHLGRSIAAHLREGRPLAPFTYRSRGNTAIVGRHAAVYETKHRHMKGWPAWALWAVVHVYLLVGFQNRLIVSLQWLWRYLTYHRGARLMSEPAEISADQRTRAATVEAVPMRSDP